MTGTLALLLGLALLLAAAFALLPRVLIRRAQDRLARARIEREAGRFKLLTRADLAVGRFRRLPGILGLTAERLTFEGLFGESVELATSRIRKIETGRRLSSGRVLLRRETLRFTPVSGDPLEFVLTAPAAFAWRSHLGLWAARERQAHADQVTAGRS